MNSKTKLTLLTFVFGSFFYGISQENTPTTPPKEHTFFKKLRFSGNLGVAINSNQTSVVATPSVLYPVSKNFFIGPGIGLGYTAGHEGTKTRQTNLSGALIGIYNSKIGLQGSLELEQNFIFQSYKISGSDTRERSSYNYPALFVGMGYQTRNISFGLRYDLLFNDEKSIYRNALVPFVRVFI